MYSTRRRLRRQGRKGVRGRDWFTNFAIATMTWRCFTRIIGQVSRSREARAGALS